MDRLRNLFELQGFSAVETYIASGNVVFETPDNDVDALQRQIEASLQGALGYAVAAFIRTPMELSAIAGYAPFPQVDLDRAQVLNVAFLSSPLDIGTQQRLMMLTTDIDNFHVHGREVYWLCRKKQSQSTFSNAVLEKTIGRSSTLRGINTLRKMAEKYAPNELN